MGYPRLNPSQAYSMYIAFAFKCKNLINGTYTFPKRSKIALTALTKLQQKSFDLDETRSGIIVNSVCPGKYFSCNFFLKFKVNFNTNFRVLQNRHGT